jgi:small subunit ribosomal protein S1
LEKRHIDDISEPEEVLDDQWWESIISEERIIKSVVIHPSGTNQKTDLSTKQGRMNWELIQKLFETEQIITVAVTGYNHGGLLVEWEGIEGFIPSSHLVRIQPGKQQHDKRRILAGLLGKRLTAKVIEYDPGLEKIILSERAAQVEAGRRKTLLESLKPGDRVTGIVTNITSFGVFIDLGGLEGLVHVSELSWCRVNNPGDLLMLGQQLELKVIQISAEKSRVALSLKQLFPNPWEELAIKRKPGAVFPAVITQITGFGAFAKLEGFGVEGLIHHTSLHLSDSIQDLHNIFRVNQPVNVTILHIDTEKRRLGLNLEL